MKISVFYEHIAEAAVQSGKSIPELCKLISSWGIQGIEIEDKRLLSEQKNILESLQHANLEISCIYGFFDFSHNCTITKGYELVDMADNLHVKKIMPIPGFIYEHENNSPHYQNCLNRMLDSLYAICSYAGEKNITTVLEDFDDKSAPFSTAVGLKYFLDNVAELYCTFDTGNFLYSNEDSFKVLPMFLNKIKHVHCKDRSFKKNEYENAKATIDGRNMYSSPVGSGCIKMKEIIKTIKENGYDDYFAIEHFGAPNQLSYIKESVDWLKQF